MDWREHITADPGVCHGAACFKGTRVMVSVVLDNLAAGGGAEAILLNFPSLHPEAIPAAIAYAAEIAYEMTNTSLISAVPTTIPRARRPLI